MSFQKDRSCQCRDDSEEPSLGHRRLRFSFQINDFKDRVGRFPTRRTKPGGGERRRFSRPGFSSQAFSSEEPNSFALLDRRANPGVSGSGVSKEGRSGRQPKLQILQFSSTVAKQDRKKVSAGAVTQPRRDDLTIRSKARKLVETCEGGKRIIGAASLCVRPVPERGGGIGGSSGRCKLIPRCLRTFSGRGGAGQPAAI